ncbi:TetR family transcriptional regulator [Streptomyces carminius]|uniref:TetR family transcriptional regulator n=1 Tax=Streptomyces carminius TaxID=2665496 RepID=A0A2M8LSA3_9ACTN|nr:TetR family transcriptional regulator [Streptomyces carminius]
MSGEETAGRDPRTVRTRARLRRALLAECADRPLAEVSVSAVVRRAGVGRATFYLHYEDLPALAVDACAEVVRDAVEAVHAFDGPPDPAVPPPALTAFLTSAAARAGLYRGLLHPGGGGPLGELLHRELRDRSRRERARAGLPYAAAADSAVAAAFTGVFADWLHGLVEAAPEDLARQLWRLVLTVHRAFGPPPP